MQTIAWRFGVPLVALGGGLIGAVPVFPLGLVLPGFIIWPLTLGIGALCAALSASWFGNLLDPGRRRSALLKVVGVAEVAVAVIILFLLTPLSRVLRLPNIYILALCLVVVALSTSWATWQFRSAGRPLGRDALLTLVLLALAILLVPGTLFIAERLGVASP